MMRRILEELSAKIGARGSLVITRDGIAVASTSRAEFNVERVAALAQRVIRDSLEACRATGLPGFDRFTLTADHGRMIFVELEMAYLVIITNLSTDTEQIMLEVETTAREIERATRIAV